MIRPSLHRKTGGEVFSLNGRPNGQSLLDFWRWSVSDLVSNATRGRLAEFIVGSALGVDFCRVRDEWQAWDLETPKGLKIEVKSSGYIQSWAQAEPSRISFSIKEAHVFDPATGRVAAEPTRPADVYVFCLHHHLEPETIDPLRLEQWSFWAVATCAIDAYERSRHSITVPSLAKLALREPAWAAGPFGYGDLAPAVHRHSPRARQPDLRRLHRGASAEAIVPDLAGSADMAATHADPDRLS